MKLIDRAAVCECKTRDAFTRCDASCCQFLRVFTDDVLCSRITFAVVVDVNTASIEWNYVADLVDEDLERVRDVERSSKHARDFVKRIDLAVRFLDLIVSDERTALACLGQVDCAQLNRRLSRVVGGLMLESKLSDLHVKTWQVLEKLLDDHGIEVNAGAAQQ